MSYMNVKIKLFITVLIFTGYGCSDSSTGPAPSDLTGEYVEYEILSSDNSEISGKVTFKERVDGYTVAEVELNNLDEESEYPVNIYEQNVLEAGELLVKLNPVDSEDGKSETLVYKDEDDKLLDYEGLLTINAHIRVHPDTDDLETTIAYGDIGDNALTGESIVVDLLEMNDSGVNGFVEFFERKSGAILTIIELEGTNGEYDHPAHIYEYDDDGHLLHELNPVDSEHGISKTNISELQNGTSFGFEDLSETDGKVQIYLSEDNMSVIASGEFENGSE